MLASDINSGAGENGINFLWCHSIKDASNNRAGVVANVNGEASHNSDYAGGAEERASRFIRHSRGTVGAAAGAGEEFELAALGEVAEVLRAATKGSGQVGQGDAVAGRADDRTDDGFEIEDGVGGGRFGMPELEGFPVEAEDAPARAGRADIEGEDFSGVRQRRRLVFTDARKVHEGLDCDQGAWQRNCLKLSWRGGVGGFNQHADSMLQAKDRKQNPMVGDLFRKANGGFGGHREAVRECEPQMRCENRKVLVRNKKAVAIRATAFSFGVFWPVGQGIGGLNDLRNHGP